MNIIYFYIINRHNNFLNIINKIKGSWLILLKSKLLALSRGILKKIIIFIIFLEYIRIIIIGLLLYIKI